MEEECPKNEIGFHEWEEDYLIPEHWASEDRPTPTKERARCKHCGANGDISLTMPSRSSYDPDDLGF